MILAHGNIFGAFVVVIALFAALLFGSYMIFSRTKFYTRDFQAMSTSQKVFSYTVFLIIAGVICFLITFFILKGLSKIF
ncbi:MAG TPA: hypothetical protein VGD40_24120 [Chryseosolibacter sp.]